MNLEFSAEEQGSREGVRDFLGRRLSPELSAKVLGLKRGHVGGACDQSLFQTPDLDQRNLGRRGPSRGRARRPAAGAESVSQPTSRR